jgi:hypothetical protein
MNTNNGCRDRKALPVCSTKAAIITFESVYSFNLGRESEERQPFGDGVGAEGKTRHDYSRTGSGGLVVSSKVLTRCRDLA